MLRYFLKDKLQMKTMISHYTCDLSNVWMNTHVESFKLTVVDIGHGRTVDFAKLKRDMKHKFHLNRLNQLKGFYLIYKDDELFIVGSSEQDVYKTLKRDIKIDKDFEELLESTNISMDVVKIHEDDLNKRLRLETIITDIYMKLHRNQMRKEYGLKI